MALSRKHFEELARIAGTVKCQQSRADLTTELVAFCRLQNPNFDAGKFRYAVERRAEYGSVLAR